MIPKQLTIAQASELLGIRPNSLRAMCKAGQITHRKIGPRGGRYRFEESWLEEYLDSTVKEAETKTSKSSKKKPTPKPKRSRGQLGQSKSWEECKSSLKELRKSQKQ